MTTICVPEIGDSSKVTVIEVAVAFGDTVTLGDTLIVLESDKASMEIPAEISGIIGIVHVTEGTEVSEGDPICELEGNTAEQKTESTNEISRESKSEVAEGVTADLSSAHQLIAVPDTGNADGITVIEIAVVEGDFVTEGDILIVLESDKASMEIPATHSGKILSLKVSEGDSVVEGDPICELEVQDSQQAAKESATEAEMDSSSKPLTSGESDAEYKPNPTKNASEVARVEQGESTLLSSKDVSGVHAGPAVRAMARELMVKLKDVPSTGPRGRITKDDLYNYVRGRVSVNDNKPPATGLDIPAIPKIDFESYGPVERAPMTKIHKLTADNMKRCWLNVPSVTQFDEADITDLEAFRKMKKPDADTRGIRLTPLPFLIKASAYALREFPLVNSSIDLSTDEIVKKDFVNIGVAVDTPDGLLVPVIRDADQKGIWELASEISELADKARTKKLRSQEMQGATFTISSLGSIGGSAFTPIVPAPQAAILGVSKASIKPIWDGSNFQPRLMLPLCLSYDHRIINGGDGARFTSLLGSTLADIRHLLL